MIKEFVTDCQARGMTINTVQTYRSCCRHFLKANPDPGKVSTQDLVKYLGELRSRNLAGSTLKGYFSAIGAYYEYLMFSKRKLKANPIPSFRKRYLHVRLNYYTDNMRQLISPEQMSDLINSARMPLPRTIMLFLAKTGIRRGELISMDIGDINMEKGEFRIKPKAKRSNCIGFMDAELIEQMKIYLDWRELREKNDALWITYKGTRINKNHPYNTVIKYAKKLKLHDPKGSLDKKFTPHCFRHFFTTHLRRAKMPREFIQELRGDRRREAVDIYDHIEVEELRKSYLACVPSLGTGPGRTGTLEEWCK